MSSDLLRRAAIKLREQAEAATPGPWEVDHEDLYFILRTRKPVAYTYEADIVEVHSPDATWADFDFFALMHPPVALALAEMLDHVADDVSDAGDRVEPGGLVRNEYDSIRFDWTAAVKLAREILREPERAS